MLKKGTPASPATARAMSVLPVPGGPTRRTPRGMRAPSELNFSGYFRNSTTSWSSVFASSTPATSAKVTTVLLPRNIRARLLPKLIAWLFVPWAWRIMKKRKPPISMTGRMAPMSRLIHCPLWEASLPENTIVVPSGVGLLHVGEDVREPDPGHDDDVRVLRGLAGHGELQVLLLDLRDLAVADVRQELGVRDRLIAR